MNAAAPVSPAPRTSQVALLFCVGLVSAAVISYEIVLMRRLLIESWHHFGYLVISAALLGFGASGTLLGLFEARVSRNPVRVIGLSTLALTLSLLVLPRIGSLLPTNAQFIPSELRAQIGWWTLYWLAALVPFLLGAAVIGAGLMAAGARLNTVYAANLIGSGLGAVAAVLLVAHVPLPHMLWPVFGLTLLAWLLRPLEVTRERAPWLLTRLAIALMLTGAAVGLHAWWPWLPIYDQYKYAAHLQQLVAQDMAERVAARPDPHGYVELYASDLFHDLPFVALNSTPPAMYSLVVNGDPGGSILRIDREADASVMDTTLMAFPYRLLPPQPRVLLVGLQGGANIWLARRQNAAHIDVVQPNGALAKLVREFSPALLADPRVHLHLADPRRFMIKHPHERYDLVQMVALEGLGVSGAGMRGLAEDHLATVEGFAALWHALDDDGLLAISRGIQIPPRVNIRILATLAEALRSAGVTEPARYLVQVRDYLGVCTIALKTPLTSERRTALRSAHQALNLTPVWYDSLWIADVNQPDALPGPPGLPWDWLHHAAREVLSPRRGQFYDEWLFDVRPPTDDSPFFWDFYKPAAVTVLKEAYGDLWLTRAELGRLFLYTSLGIAIAGALVLILLPLAVGAPWRSSAANRTPMDALLFTLLYFTAIGLGFMGVEMALISRAIHWLGNPVIASATVIGAMLVLSGTGSLTGRHVLKSAAHLAPFLVAGGVVIVRLVGWSASDTLLLLPIAFPTVYLMGLPMPTGLAHLHAHAPRLVPWAWGLNGIASVIATSAAIAIAMSAGYRAVMLLAALAYLLAGLTSWWLRPRAVVGSPPA